MCLGNVLETGVEERWGATSPRSRGSPSSGRIAPAHALLLSLLPACLCLSCVRPDMPTAGFPDVGWGACQRLIFSCAFLPAQAVTDP